MKNQINTGLLEFRKTEFQNALLCVRIELV